MKHPGIKSFIRLATLLGGIMASGMVQAQPAINNIYPDGAYQFQPSPTLSFSATSPGGVTGVSVQLTATTLSGQSSFKTLTPGHGLAVTGPSTGEAVSCSLKTNLLYTAVIQVNDANSSASTTVSFDTIAPVYTWEAEDWDYTDTNTMTAGLYIDNPQTNAYQGLATTDNVDANNNNGNGAYRPVGTSSAPGGLATEGASDKPRVQYIGTGKTDYDVGFTDGGDFGSYTRHYPAGTYNVYMRGADGGGQAADSASISVVGGTGVLSANGTVSVPNMGGWQAWSWVPFKDSSGNLVTVTFDGSPTTLRVTTDGGSYNANFYMLLPTNLVQVGGAADAVITNVYPDGSYQFQWTNTLSFVVNSSLGVNLGDVVVQLNATNLDGTGTSQVLGNGSGLTITGDSTNLSVAAALRSNALYTVSIQITDANGNGSVSNLTFDTIIPFYTFEAEDWDYGTGQFFDNPQVDAYANLDGGTPEIDQHCPNNVHSYAYRGGVLSGFGLNTETLGEIPRLSLGGLQDYDIGFTDGGDWANYTRHYPAGIYNIYVRAARGDGGNVADAGNIAVVTSGYQTQNQTTSKLGTYSVASTGNWGKYGWNAVRDTAGNLARFSADGTLKTLRVTMDGAGHNQNFFMLIPADLSKNPPPYVSGFTPDGSAMFQNTNQLSFVVNSAAGISTNGIVLNLNGKAVSGFTVSGTTNLWSVSYPVRTNAYYTAIITLSDSAGTTVSTNTFGTFDSADYQWEAEDYDYGSRQYFDNPQVDAYNTLSPVSGVDCLESDANAGNGSFAYRPSPTGALAIPAGTGDVSSEPQRDQFASGGVNYNIGYFGNGSWANYTRHYPAGTYNVYGRFAEGQAATAATLSKVVSGFGTTDQATDLLGTFFIPLSGWTSWKWAPLTDASGNLVRVTFDGSETTLRLSGFGSGPEANIDFLMLAPADLTVPVISGMYPNGTAYFQDSSTLGFGVSSAAGVDTNSIIVVLNGAAVTNLTFAGSSTNWSVGYSGLRSNTTYTAVITVTTLSGAAISLTNRFDTFYSGNYQWEAEDFDYSGGKFFDSPQVFAYYGLAGEAGVDYVESDVNAVNGSFLYRPAPSIPTGTGDVASDGQRSQFTTGKTNYNIGYFGVGTWANYTRHYPLGTYTVWGRFAEGNNSTVALLSQVVSGVGTTNQGTSLLGTFQVPAAGWTSWEWAPLTDASGNLAKVTFDGSQTTLRLGGGTVSGQDEVNIDFLMLTPTMPAPKITSSIASGHIALSFVTQSGYSYQVLHKDNLTDAIWTPLGSPVVGNNAVQSVNEPMSVNSGFYRLQIQQD
jgi:hypothetical protein